MNYYNTTGGPRDGPHVFSVPFHCEFGAKLELGQNVNYLGGAV